MDALVALGAALLCAGLLALTALGAALALAAALTGQVAGRIGRLAELLAPRAVRAAVGVVVGVAVVGAPVVGCTTGLATAAEATPAAVAAARGTLEPDVHTAPPRQLPPGWSPDRPADVVDEPAAEAPSVPAGLRNQPSTGRAGADRSATVRHLAPVVVRRGDTLWAIAARHLGPAATDAQVAAEWPRWHAANRSTIGADPDVIVPGQRLRAPASQPPTHPAPTHRTE